MTDRRDYRTRPPDDAPDRREHVIETLSNGSLVDTTAVREWLGSMDRRLTPPKRERFVRAADRERTT
jgi:hypothetical protein